MDIYIEINDSFLKMLDMTAPIDGGGNKLFKAMNTILGKCILITSLSMAKCCTGNANKGIVPYFEKRQKSNKIYSIKKKSGNIVLKKEYDGLLPNFVEITEDLDNKKAIEKVILNLQILLLFNQMTSSNKGPLLSALYLKYDSQNRTVNKIKQNGYWSKTNEKNTKEISTHFSNTSTDNITQKDIIGLILKRRQQYFGNLFNVAIDKVPKWFTDGNNEDDYLQNAMNKIIETHFKDNIYFSGKYSKTKKNVKKLLPDAYKSYIINNASVGVSNGFLNLKGSVEKNLEYCPITSIADAQKLCAARSSNTPDKMVEYDMNMILKVKDNEQFMYKVSFTKDIEDDSDMEDDSESEYDSDDSSDDEEDFSYKLKGKLIFEETKITIGDDNFSNLSEDPLSAVSSYYKMLGNISSLVKNYQKYKKEEKAKALAPPKILSNFINKNIKEVQKYSILKSFGDYGQEFTAISKWSGGSPEEVMLSTDIALNYDELGNSFRVMIANDRPSAYRIIFLILFGNINTINNRCIGGYFNNNKSKKNFLVNVRDKDSDFLITTKGSKTIKIHDDEEKDYEEDEEEKAEREEKEKNTKAIIDIVKDQQKNIDYEYKSYKFATIVGPKSFDEFYQWYKSRKIRQFLKVRKVGDIEWTAANKLMKELKENAKNQGGGKKIIKIYETKRKSNSKSRTQKNSKINKKIIVKKLKSRKRKKKAFVKSRKNKNKKKIIKVKKGSRKNKIKRK